MLPGVPSSERRPDQLPSPERASATSQSLTHMADAAQVNGTRWNDVCREEPRGPCTACVLIYICRWRNREKSDAVCA